MRISRPGRRGFTLAEVLVGLLIALLCLGGLLTSLRAGIQAYRTLDRDADPIHQTRLFAALLQHELRNALPHAEIPFRGEERLVSFPALLEDFAEDRVRETPFLVTYEYREKALYRKVAPLRGVFAEKKESSKKILAPVKKFVVQYAYRTDRSSPILWQDSWPGDQGLPRGIRISIAFEGEGAAGVPESFIRKFFIPQGSWGWIKEALS